MEIRDSRILLTGASGGIGLELARQLLEAGARLLVVGRQGPALQALVQRRPDRVQAVVADLTTAQGRAAVADAARDFGGLDALVNAAGVNDFAWLEQQDEDAIAALLQLNVTATLQLTHRLLPLLRRSRGAVIANVGSTFGSIGYPGFAAYCASKFAIRGFSQALRRELADTGIRVLYVAPRATRTAMNGAAVTRMNEQLGVAMDDPAVVAACILRALRGGRDEVYLGWPEKLFVRLNALWPRLVDRALRRQLPVVRGFARPGA
jgi:short-subunit dehydrogenase